MKFSYLCALVFASAVAGQVTYHSGVNINKCLDLSTGEVVVIFDCNGSTAQEWVPDLNGPAIHVSSNRNLCLDGGGNPEVGSPLLVTTCNPNFVSQRFTPTLNGDFIELNALGLCIGLPSDNVANANIVRLADCSPSDNGQVWHAAEVKRD